MATFRPLLLISLIFFHYFSGTESTSLTITNNCDDTIWPVVSPPPGDGLPGFSLSPGGSRSLILPQNWSGLAWARTRCVATPAGDFSCATGDLISGSRKPSPPATEVEFGSGGEYCLSVENGYNIPITVVPTSGGCSTVGCTINYGTAYFPPELRAGDVNDSSAPTGIKSSCYAETGSCGANSYSEIFKKLCPQARSYASDYVGTVFSCGYSEFAINFCSLSSGSGNPGNVPRDGHNNNYNFGKTKLISKCGIIIGVGIGISGMVLIFCVWRFCKKSKASCSCCSLFSCTCCPDKDSDSDDDHHHHHSDKC